MDSVSHLLTALSKLCLKCAVARGKEGRQDMNKLVSENLSQGCAWILPGRLNCVHGSQKQTNKKPTQPIAKLTWCYPVEQCRCGDLSSRSLECTSYASIKWQPCYIVNEMNYSLASAAHWKPQQLPRTNHGWERRPPLFFSNSPHIWI